MDEKSKNSQPDKKISAEQHHQNLIKAGALYGEYCKWSKKIKEEGVEARKREATLADNPYSEETNPQEHELWQEGWEEKDLVPPASYMDSLQRLYSLSTAIIVEQQDSIKP